LKDINKIIIFFIILCVLFWNPISFYLFYSGYDIYYSKAVTAIFWLAPMAGILLILIIKKYKNLSPKALNIIFASSFLGISFAILVVLNSFIGLFNSKPTDNSQNISNKGLIFNPNTSAHYSTVEFDYKAEINNLGLRNRNIEVEKSSNTYRVLCFGDSWTFGWGVELNKSWPMQMESYLKEKGFSNIEVINCGQGGKYTTIYKKYMSEILPLLKPDLVLVGVLQLDDLAQLYENNFLDQIGHNVINRWAKVTILTKRFLKASFNNYLRLLTKGASKEVFIKSTWEFEGKDFINKLNNTQKMVFSTLSDTVPTLFQTGNLNPGMLNSYINFPNKTQIFNNPNHPATKSAIKQLDIDIKGMKDICITNNAEMVFINLPLNTFTGHIVDRTALDYLNDYLMTNNNIDSIYYKVAKTNNVRYFELTEHFIGLPEKEKYFFKFDGHPNEKGYKEIGVSIAKYLTNNNLIKN